MTLAYALIRC